MPAFLAPLAITGISALASLLSGRKKKATQENTTTQNTSGTETYDNTSNPTLTPEALQALSILLPQLQNRVNNGADFSGYTQGGLRNIASTGETNRNRIIQSLAARGLNNSPAAATILARQGDTQATDTANFLSGIPLLQRQTQGQDLDQLIKVAMALPTGMRQTGTTTRSATGTSTSKGTSTTPGDMLGGLFGGLGQGLASTYGYNWVLEQQKKLAGGINPRGISGTGSGYAP